MAIFTGDSEKDVELWGKAAQSPREQAREDIQWSLPKPRGRTWAFDTFSPPSAVGWCPGRGRWQWGPHQPLISEGLAGWTPGPGPVPPPEWMRARAHPETQYGDIAAPGQRDMGRLESLKTVTPGLGRSCPPKRQVQDFELCYINQGRSLQCIPGHCSDETVGEG